MLISTDPAVSSFNVSSLSSISVSLSSLSSIPLLSLSLSSVSSNYYTITIIIISIIIIKMSGILFIVIVILASCDSLRFSYSSSVSSISRRRITYVQSQKVEDNDEGKVKDNDWPVKYLVPVILSLQIFNSFQTSQQFSAIQEVVVKQVEQGTAMKDIAITQNRLMDIQKDQGAEMKKLSRHREIILVSIEILHRGIQRGLAFYIRLYLFRASTICCCHKFYGNSNGSQQRVHSFFI